MIVLCPTCEGCGLVHIRKTPHPESPKRVANCLTCESTGWIENEDVVVPVSTSVAGPSARPVQPNTAQQDLLQHADVKPLSPEMQALGKDLKVKQATRELHERLAEVAKDMKFDYPSRDELDNMQQNRVFDRGPDREEAGGFFSPEESMIGSSSMIADSASDLEMYRMGDASLMNSITTMADATTTTTTTATFTSTLNEGEDYYIPVRGNAANASASNTFSASNTVEDLTFSNQALYETLRR